MNNYSQIQSPFKIQIQKRQQYKALSLIDLREQNRNKKFQYRKKRFNYKTLLIKTEANSNDAISQESPRLSSNLCMLLPSENTLSQPEKIEQVNTEDDISVSDEWEPSFRKDRLFQNCQDNTKQNSKIKLPKASTNIPKCQMEPREMGPHLQFKKQVSEDISNEISDYLQSSSDCSLDELKHQIDVEESTYAEQINCNDSNQYQFELQKVIFLFHNIKQVKKIPCEILPFQLKIGIMIQMLHILNYEVQQLRDTLILKINIFHIKKFYQFCQSENYARILGELDNYLSKFEWHINKFYKKFNENLINSRSLFQQKQCKTFIQKDEYFKIKSQLYNLYKVHYEQLQYDFQKSTKLQVKFAFYLLLSTKHNIIFDLSLLKKIFLQENLFADKFKVSDFEKLNKWIESVQEDEFIQKLINISLNVSLYSNF